MDINTMNVLVIAYLGDVYFESLVREHLVFNENLEKVQDLQKRATKIVSATGQSQIMTYLIKNELLSETEIVYYKRGRNAKIRTFKKDIANYHSATGLEVLVGYLKLSGQEERLIELFNIMLKVDIT